jgi:hypothetical protein
MFVKQYHLYAKSYDTIYVMRESVQLRQTATGAHVRLYRRISKVIESIVVV